MKRVLIACSAAAFAVFISTAAAQNAFQEGGRFAVEQEHLRAQNELLRIEAQRQRRTLAEEEAMRISRLSGRPANLVYACLQSALGGEVPRKQRHFDKLDECLKSSEAD